MYGYKININRYCDESHESEEQYGDWSSSYSNSFDSVKQISKYPDLVSVEKLKIGDSVFVVWCEWSSGDSFGNSYCGNTEGVAIFSKEEDALGLSDAIYKKRKDFKASTGQVFGFIGAPWSGYFEKLEEVHISSAVLK